MCGAGIPSHSRSTRERPACRLLLGLGHRGVGAAASPVGGEGSPRKGRRRRARRWRRTLPAAIRERPGRAASREVLENPLHTSTRRAPGAGVPHSLLGPAGSSGSRGRSDLGARDLGAGASARAGWAQGRREVGAQRSRTRRQLPRPEQQLHRAPAVAARLVRGPQRRSFSPTAPRAWPPLP